MESTRTPQPELGTWEPIELGTLGFRVGKGKEFGKAGRAGNSWLGEGAGRGRGRDSYPDRAPAFSDRRVWKN